MLGYLRMSWWLLQLGPTRSHPELGRETNSRQWYFGLSRGRVGHCQLFLEYPLPIPPLLIPPSLLYPAPLSGLSSALKIILLLKIWIFAYA